MSDICATVKIKSANKSGHVVINESDFDAAQHERFVEPPPVAVPVSVIPPPPPAPVDPLAGLPNNWKADKSNTSKLRAVAQAVTGRTVENRHQAVETIEAALAARQ